MDLPIEWDRLTLLEALDFDVGRRRKKAKTMPVRKTA